MVMTSIYTKTMRCHREPTGRLSSEAYSPTLPGQNIGFLIYTMQVEFYFLIRTQMNSNPIALCDTNRFFTNNFSVFNR